MNDFFKNLFGLGPKTDFAELVKNGAIIIDVRSKSEFNSGHTKGAINIPVENLANNLNQLKEKDKAIITCCASGMRSAAAKNILLAKGYTQVYNGGGWYSLQQKIY